MAGLTAEAIFAIPRTAPEAVKVAEWGGEVWVRLLTGAQRDAMFSGLKRNADDTTDMRDLRARLLSAAIVKEDGSPMFTQEQALQADDDYPAAAVRLFNIAQRINKLRPEDMEAASGN